MQSCRFLRRAACQEETTLVFAFSGQHQASFQATTSPWDLESPDPVHQLLEARGDLRGVLHLNRVQSCQMRAQMYQWVRARQMDWAHLLHRFQSGLELKAVQLCMDVVCVRRTNDRQEYVRTEDGFAY